MPLDDDNDGDFKPKNTLKIKNENSPKPSGQSAKQAFEQRATDAFKDDEDFKKQAYTLGKSFVNLIEDRTLPENKSPMSKDIERESLQNLIALGIDMNADENQPEGTGSIGLITLLLKALIIQRDRINMIEYKQSKMLSNVQNQDDKKSTKE